MVATQISRNSRRPPRPFVAASVARAPHLSASLPCRSIPVARNGRICLCPHHGIGNAVGFVFQGIIYGTNLQIRLQLCSIGDRANRRLPCQLNAPGRPYDALFVNRVRFLFASYAWTNGLLFGLEVLVSGRTRGNLAEVASEKK
jgi:hypothetical protein